MGNDGVGLISDINVIWIEVSAVRRSGGRVIEEENGNKTNGRVWNKKGIVKNKFAGLALQNNITDANGIDGETTKALNRVRLNWAKRGKIGSVR